MRKWIVLLRGINVSGQKKIIMADLRELLAANGFTKVVTYIQSGNLILEAEPDSPQKEVEKTIGTLLANTYDFTVEVFAFQATWLKQVIADNPFLSGEGVDTKQLYLTILDRLPAKDDLDRLAQLKLGADEYFIKETVIYLRYPNGAGKARLTNNLIEAKLRLRATSRNWKTTLKLLELAT